HDVKETGNLSSKLRRQGWLGESITLLVLIGSSEGQEDSIHGEVTERSDGSTHLLRVLTPLTDARQIRITIGIIFQRPSHDLVHAELLDLRDAVENDGLVTMVTLLQLGEELAEVI